MKYLKRIFIFVGALLAVLSIYGSDFSPIAVGEKSNPVAQDSLKPVAVKTSTKSSVKNSSTNYYARMLERSGINLRPGSEHREDSKETPQSAAKCKSNVYKTLIALPLSHRKQLKNLTLFYSDEGRRGLGGNQSIVLRCTNVTDTELSSVFTHEMGHIIDASLFVGTEDAPWSGFNDFDDPVSEDDPSVSFYRISWDTDKDLKWEATEQNFVSKYAMSDPFEDFAETYAFYRWHGPEFRVLAATDYVLAQKYDFMRSFVFSGREFGDLDHYPEFNTSYRNYDVTVLPIL